MSRIVLDTNIFVSALLGPRGPARGVLRMALQGAITPVFGNALFCEYQDVLARRDIFEDFVLNAIERDQLFDALLSVSEWASVHFLWRPNLRDEADNHIVELAVSAGASEIVTANIRDFRQAELLFPALWIGTADDFLKRRPLP